MSFLRPPVLLTEHIPVYVGFTMGENLAWPVVKHICWQWISVGFEIAINLLQPKLYILQHGFKLLVYAVDNVVFIW